MIKLDFSFLPLNPDFWSHHCTQAQKEILTEAFAVNKDTYNNNQSLSHYEIN